MYIPYLPLNIAANVLSKLICAKVYSRHNPLITQTKATQRIRSKGCSSYNIKHLEVMMTYERETIYIEVRISQRRRKVRSNQITKFALLALVSMPLIVLVFEFMSVYTSKLHEAESRFTILTPPPPPIADI